MRFDNLLTMIFAGTLCAASGLAETTESAKPFQYRLRQILLEPTISPEHRQSILNRAEACLKIAQNGADFTELARRNSEEPGADRTGGDLGFFTYEQMVKPFSDTVFAMNPGDVFGLVETQFGFHIIKLLEVDGDRRHAQHILFELVPGSEDSSAVLDTLAVIKKRIDNGESFDAVFDQYNTNRLLNSTRGYLVWQEPDDMLPSFSQHISGLMEGEVTEPFESVVGFHIVLVDSINYNREHPLEGFPPGFPLE